MKAKDFFAKYNNFEKIKHIESILKYGVRQKNIYVSIMIPTYKRPELLKETISSVINQHNYDDFEVVIVDNDFTLDSYHKIIKIIEDFNDKRISYYVNQENIGMFGNYNRCIELANGEYMTILSDDDFLLPNYLEEMTNFIKQQDFVARVECKYFISDQRNIVSFRKKVKNFIKVYLFGYNNGLKEGWFYKLSGLFYNFLGKKHKKIELAMYLTGCFTAPHSQLYKTSFAKELGGFNSDFDPFADFVFNASYVHHFNHCYQINKYLCVYRMLVNYSLLRKAEFGCMQGDKRIGRSILKIIPHHYSNYLLNSIFMKCRVLRFKKSKLILIYGNLYRFIKLFYNLPFK